MPQKSMTLKHFTYFSEFRALQNVIPHQHQISLKSQLQLYPLRTDASLDPDTY